MINDKTDIEKKLIAIMKEYINTVNILSANLITGLNSSEDICLRTKFDFMNYRAKIGKMEFEVNGISYKLHGIGCMAFSEKFFLDWDFGYRSRWCGIDPWKLATTLKQNQCYCVEYYDGGIIENLCEKFVLDGDMFKYCHQYYFTIPFSETFKPNFPKEFDKLIIKNFNNEWLVSRNKDIDRFLRKATRIHGKVGNYGNKYKLIFLLKNKELYTITYDDISYPENAIKIMSDNILRNLEK